MRFASAAALALALAACAGGETGGSSTSTTTTGAGGQPPEGVPSFPQVVNVGGAVLAKPRVRAIVYGDDPHAAELDDFLAELAGSATWDAAMSEYGVGALSVLPTVKRSGAAPASVTDAQIVDDLDAHCTGAAPWGMPDPGTITVFVMPEGTVVDAGGACCDTFDGYHDEATVAGVAVPYAVVCSCPGFDGPDVTDVQQITVAVSHELFEAATDPLPRSAPAFYQTDDDHAAWTMATGGEVADLCEMDAASFVIPAGMKHMVQKSWSNREARWGRWPCVPHMTETPFFAAVPSLADHVTIQGWPVPAAGALIGLGKTRAVSIDLWSAAPLSAPIQVRAVDVAEYFGGTASLHLSLDRDTGAPGETLQLTIENTGAAPALGVSIFALEAWVDGVMSMSLGVVNTH